MLLKCSRNLFYFYVRVGYVGLGRGFWLLNRLSFPSEVNVVYYRLFIIEKYFNRLNFIILCILLSWVIIYFLLVFEIIDSFKIILFFIVSMINLKWCIKFKRKRKNQSNSLFYNFSSLFFRPELNLL